MSSTRRDSADDSTDDSTDGRDATPAEAPPAPASAARSPRAVWAYRALGVVLAVVTWLLLGLSATLEPDARIVAAVGVLMATWWITEAIPLAATALIPIIAFPLFDVRTIGETTARYADPIVFLFLGGFLIAIAMQKWHLHRRIALVTLRTVGTTPNRIVLGMMIACGFLALWVSNTAVALMMLPIALSVLTLVAERCSGERPTPGRPLSECLGDPGVRAFGVALMLAVAWASSIGGLGSLVATVPNAMLAAYMAEEFGVQLTFLDWMMVGVPLSVVFILITWLLLTRVLFRTSLTEIPGGRELIAEQLRGMGPISRAEKRVLAVFAGAATMWIVPGLVTEIDAVDAALPWLADLSDTTVAIAAGVALFLIPAASPVPDAEERDPADPGVRRHRMLLAWDDAQKGLPWGVLLLFGGGLSLAGGISASGLDAYIGSSVEAIGTLPTIALMIAVVAMVLAMGELTSNTATAATIIPVLGAAAVGLGTDPLVLLVPAALATTCTFMLPVGTPPNAIVFSSGAVTIGQMARGGAILNVVGVVLISLTVYMLGGWALGLQF